MFKVSRPKLNLFVALESGRLEFEEFVTLAAKFIVEEDDEAMQKELKEAFRLYDKEGEESVNPTVNNQSDQVPIYNYTLVWLLAVPSD